MNDKLIPLVIIESFPLDKGMQKLRNDQYKFLGNFPKLENFLEQKNNVKLELPQKAKLLYLSEYVLIIDFLKNNNVSITIYKEKHNDALYQILWDISTNTYTHACFSNAELIHQKENPFLYTGLAVLNHTNANTSEIFTKNILKTVRLFLYVLTYEPSIIRKERNLHVVNLQKLQEKLSVVRGYTKNNTTKVSAHLRRHK